MQYEAEPAKAASNLAKHGVSFAEAFTCLLDPMALTMSDDGEGETRWVLVGGSERGRVLTVVYAMHGEVPRLIRPAKPQQERASCES